MDVINKEVLEKVRSSKIDVKQAATHERYCFLDLSQYCMKLCQMVKKNKNKKILQFKSSEEALDTLARRTLITISQILLLFMSPDFLWHQSTDAKIA